MDEIKQIFRDKQFKKLFVGDTDNTLIQFFRYLFVGGLAFVVDFALSYILFRFAFGEQKEFGWIANSLSFIAGLAVNYVISTFWIFKNSKVENKFVEFISFAAIGFAVISFCVICIRSRWSRFGSAWRSIPAVVITI